MPKQRLTALKIDEISLVPAPASPGAYVAIMKSAAGALPGVAEAIDALREARGDEAADAFASILADASEPVAKAAGGGIRERLAPAIAGLHIAVDSIFGGDEDGREAALAEVSRSFADAVEAEVAKAMPGKRAKAGSFEACAGCKSEAACAAAGVCAAEAMKDKVAKSDAEIEALGLVGETFAKAAATFASLHQNREKRDRLNQMTWALSDSFSSIMSDPEVTDKAGMIRQSVAEFDAAVAALTDEAGMKDTDMPNTDTAVNKAADEKIAALQAKIETMEKADRRRVAVAKANELLPHGGPVAELADLIEKADPEDMARLETVAKALTAQQGAAAMFGKALGSAAPAGAASEAHPLIKVAKAAAAAR